MNTTDLFGGLSTTGQALIIALQVVAALIVLPFIVGKMLLPLLWWVGLIYFGLQDSLLGAAGWCALMLFLVWSHEKLNAIPEKPLSKDEAADLLVDSMFIYAAHMREKQCLK